MSGPMRARYAELMAHPEQIEEVLQTGADKARRAATPLLPSAPGRGLAHHGGCAKTAGVAQIGQSGGAAGVQAVPRRPMACST